MNMNVVGIGVISAHGRGVASFETALLRGWVPPSHPDDCPDATMAPFAYRVDQASLSDGSISKRMRRADRFSKMAALAAWDAVRDSGIELDTIKSSLGVIVATALGPHGTTFRFLDDILTYGDAEVSPTIFSHSVHNSAASYISTILGSRGPTLTVTQFAFAFQHALMLAWTWLLDGRCKHVLVGSADECGAVMEYICSKKLRIADDGKIKPFMFSKGPVAVPGEGSVFFLLTNADSPKTYCKIPQVTLCGAEIHDCGPDICILSADGMAEDETGYRSMVIKGAFAAAYAPIFGSMMTGCAFDCAAGALMLSKQIRYGNPVQENPYGVDLCTVTEPVRVNEIWCAKLNCLGEKSVIQLCDPEGHCFCDREKT